LVAAALNPRAGGRGECLEKFEEKKKHLKKKKELVAQAFCLALSARFTFEDL
jgi:hypothetical protein